MNKLAPRPRRWVAAVLVLLAASVMSAPSANADEAFAGAGDTGGYHVFKASDAGGWRWTTLATIRPAGIEEQWIGYQCTTGDGRWIVAVVAPRRAVNRPVMRDRGGVAYVVDARTGASRPLASGVGFKYHTLGCGTDDRVAITRSLGRDQAATEVRLFSATSTRLLERHRIDGQVTSVVPTPGRMVGVAGPALVRIDGDRVRRLATAEGTPFALRPSADGLMLLAVEGERSRVLRWDGRRLREQGDGPRAGVELYAASHGLVVAVGASSSANAPRSLAFGSPPATATAVGLSRTGDVVLAAPADGAPPARGDDAAPPGLFARHGGRRIASASRRPGAGKVATEVPGEPAKVGQTARPMARAAINTTTPKCAVGRNLPNRMVPQPNSAQVNWAVQQAVRGLLRGSVLTRPAGFLNLGLVSYQPSSDFAPATLVGGAGTPVPPNVVHAIYAQESNWWQASWHALPGVGGNPLVSDYYGAAGGLSTIDYDNADCGYGVSQQTDGMTAASTVFSANGKTKVAVDYAENIAAGLQTLIGKWNQLASAGVVVNGGDPRFLENWYFALWAYNTGFHSNTGSGPWGLGWTNNPQNSDYPPNRRGFLRSTYADAEHPGDWPYQERVIGWVESPLINYKGKRSYAAAPAYLTLPRAGDFCTTSNECDPTWINPADATKSYCRRGDRQCWWHDSVRFADCARACQYGVFTHTTTDGEPAADTTYAAQCNSQLSPAAIIIDSEPTGANVRGCSGNNWRSQGSFSVAFGADSGRVPIGQIDWHQLGTGFGGHVFYSYNRPSTDPAHINTGTWSAPTLRTGAYSVQAHVPISGATSRQATYRIYPGDGTYQTVTVSQYQNRNAWIDLGNFLLRPTGARIVLTNQTSETPAGSRSVAFDAIALTFVRSPAPADARLAEHFKPKLLFDSSETWRPLNIATMMQEQDRSGQPLHRRCLPYDSADARRLLGIDQQPTTAGADDYVASSVIVARCPKISLLSAAIDWPSEDAYIDIQQLGPSIDETQFVSPDSRCRAGNLRDCNGDEIGSDDKSTIYYHVTETSGYAYVQYWAFYRFNSYTDSGVSGSHEGDWEAVAVAPSLDGGTFDFASFSQHGAWFSYLRETLSCDTGGAGASCGSPNTTGAPNRGRRLHVYVSNGDHANYPEACHEVIAHITCTRGSGAPERGYDGTQPWGHNGSTTDGLLPMPGRGTESWTDWAGHWGAAGPDLAPGTKSPRSPAAQGLFDKPWGDCAQGHTGCAIPARAEAPPAPRAQAVVTRASGSCDSWFGGGVLAAACAPRELASALRAQGLGRRGGMSMRVRRASRARTATAVAPARGGRTAGISQLVGSPLERGDRIVLGGRASAGTTVRVRVRLGRTVRALSVALPGGKLDGASVALGGSARRPALAVTW